MSVLLALTAVLILIIADMIWTRKPEKAVKPVLIRKFYHPGHTWMRVTEDGDVLVGVDEFTQSLLGTIEAVELPRLLKRVDQGSPAWKIRHGNRTLPMVSPVSGRVVQKNEAVLHNPALVNSSPYRDGWLLRIHPKALPSQTRNLISGKWVHQWEELVRGQLHRFFSGTPVLMYQDGGIMVAGLADRCSDEEWARLGREFFMVDGTTEKQTTETMS